MSEDVAKKIIKKFAPLPAGVKSREEEEMEKGVRPPKERGGRLPMFYRSEVDEIQNSLEKHAILAERFGVSVETIKRVREVGAFADIPYVARDEVDRKKPKVTTKVRAFAKSNGGHRGRPFKSGRGPLTLGEKRAIAASMTPIAETAHSFGISIQLVKKIRMEMGGAAIRIKPVSHRIVRDVHKDTRPLQEIADAHHLPVQIVRSIKEGTFSQRLLADN